MIQRLIRRFLREQDGITLVIAIAAMSVLAIATTGVIVAGTSNETTAFASTNGRSAFAVAQQALAYGEGMVYAQVAAGAQPPTTPQTLPTQPNGATGTYTVSTADDVTWNIVAIGTIGGVTRTVSVDVTPAQTVTTEQLAIWNYLYEDETLANGPCVAGGAVISMPILTNGNFCVTGTSTKILGSLQIGGGGKLTTSGSTTIGVASSPISKLAIASTANDACNILGKKTAVGVSTCDGLHSGMYATSVGHTLDVTPQMPTVNFQAAYNAQAALTKTGCPANLFDNNTTMNLSNSANIGAVMFGATAYDCFVGTNEIKWNPTTKQLYASGTFYFDGNFTSPGSMGNVVYTGLSSLYFTGGVAISSGNFCGISGCGTSWDTANNVLFMVAACWSGSTGSLDSSACVSLTGNHSFQIGFFAQTQYYIAGGSGNMAPVICDNFSISGGSHTLVPIQNFPPNTPAPTTSIAYTGAPPTGWSG